MIGLVIVESPAKCKTLNKYLGKDFKVLASYGHVRDLTPKSGAVDPDKHFSMSYELIERNIPHVKKIHDELKAGVDCLYLATDPDREGEAIAWHLCEHLASIGALKNVEIKRIFFNEITKSAVLKSLEVPREISIPLVDAQQARRALDYLVGFNLSPLLWKKVAPNLSAGRVQSPALRLIAEREDAIEAFVPQEYWTVTSLCHHQKQSFNGRLARYKGEKVEQFTFVNASQAQKVKQTLDEAAQGELLVKKVEKKQRKRNPSPPFITSTLQQEAARKLGYSAQRTMSIAQKLYEGIAIKGEGNVALITYMRTDSVAVANEAQERCRAYVAKQYGAESIPSKPNVYKTKSKNAQEAHEAIRPTDVFREPSSLKSVLKIEQLKLYELIWKRFVASQMIPATMALVGVDLACGEDHSFRASGSTVLIPGFLSVYEEGKDDHSKDPESGLLPEMVEGDRIAMKSIDTKQHFTEPPPRYTDATLVKALEQHEIGRPSTYASIISTIQSRGYVEQESKRFFLTDVGRVVNYFLTEYFGQYVDYDFTARLEARLDAVALGDELREPLLQEFWQPFKQLVDSVEEQVSREEVSLARPLGDDPESGRPVSVRIGRYGAFVQIGTKDDEEKPKFAGLKPDQKMNTITLEEALALFCLPMELGETPEGEKMVVNIGRFGPYVKYGSKYVSIKEHDPYTMTREVALQLVREKKEADAKMLIAHFEEAGIKVLDGRYGPYITDGSKNAKIEKEIDPKTLSLEDCQKRLAEAPEKKWGRGRKASPSKAAATKTAKKTSKKTTTKKKATTASSKKAVTRKKSSASSEKKPSSKKTPAKKSTTRRKNSGNQGDS